MGHPSHQALSSCTRGLSRVPVGQALQESGRGSFRGHSRAKAPGEMEQKNLWPGSICWDPLPHPCFLFSCPRPVRIWDLPGLFLFPVSLAQSLPSCAAGLSVFLPCWCCGGLPVPCLSFRGHSVWCPSGHQSASGDWKSAEAGGRRWRLQSRAALVRQRVAGEECLQR